MRDYCLATILEPVKDGISDDMLVAAQILGSEFKDDLYALEQLQEALSEEPMLDGVLVALHEGWSDLEVTKRFRNQAFDRESLHYVTELAILLWNTQIRNDRGESEKLLLASLKLINDLAANPQAYKSSVARVLVRHIRNNDHYPSLILQHLAMSPTASEKASIPRLVVAARGMSNEMRDWCKNELNSQLDGVRTPEIGYDITNGHFRPVAHCLLDIVDN